MRSKAGRSPTYGSILRVSKEMGLVTPVPANPADDQGCWSQPITPDALLPNDAGSWQRGVIPTTLWNRPL